LIGDLLDVAFKRKVARITENDLCRRDIPAIRLRAGRDEERIALTPSSEQRRLIFAEVLLEVGYNLESSKVSAGESVITD
jgi:hypothetical protein